MRFDPIFENERIFPMLGKDCLARTRPIFASRGGSNDLRALGSCFFLRYLERFFLVTAAHVGIEDAELFTRVHGRPGPLAPDKINGTFTSSDARARRRGPTEPILLLWRWTQAMPVSLLDRISMRRVGTKTINPHRMPYTWRVDGRQI